MERVDLGYDQKTGRHVSLMTTAEARFLSIFWGCHEGRDRAISGDALGACLMRAMGRNEYLPVHARERYGEWMRRHDPKGLDEAKRDARTLQNHLLTVHDRISILSAAGPGGGYWISEDAAEAESFYATFRARGLTGLLKAARGKRAILADIVQQLTFEFERQEDFAGASGGTAVEIVDRFLSEMTARPEKYADDLRRLSRKHSGILLPPEKAAALRKITAELSEMIAEVNA